MGVSQAKSPCWHNPGASAQWKNVWTTDVLPAAEFHLAEYSSLELMHAGKILVVLSQGKEKLFNPCLEASSCLLHLGADKPQFSTPAPPQEVLLAPHTPTFSAVSACAFGAAQRQDHRAWHAGRGHSYSGAAVSE